MNFKSLTAATISAVITLGTVGIYSTTGAVAADDQQLFTLNYNINPEEYDIEEPELLTPVETSSGNYVIMPEISIESGNLLLSGWTYDGFYMYEAGDYFKMPENDVTLEPVWVDIKTTTLYEISYNTVGDDYELFNNKYKGGSHAPGSAVTVTLETIGRSGYTQLGWKYEGHSLRNGDKMIMPDHDVVFEPNWFKYYSVVYYAGDVDKINGSQRLSFDKYETQVFDLADSSRLSRSGYTLSGWLCDLDDKVYKPIEQYPMPSSDVTFTAVWTAKTYVIVFKSNNGKNQTIKVSGETDTAITAPECTFEKSGYKFVGWDYEGTIYNAGEDFIVPGALPGLGISLSAVWVVDDGKDDPKPFDSISLAEARQDYIDNKITADELQNYSDFVLGK